jgi:hydroxypyruvate reductase
MREHALAIFNAAVSAVQPSRLLQKSIQLHDNTILLQGKAFSLAEWDNIFVIGAGKASAAMAVEIEKIIGEHIKKGIIVTKYGHELALQKIKCMEAGHPLPDDNSVHAGKEIMELVQHAGQKDIIVSLISGGASALLADHPPGTSLKDVQEVINRLLNCGATINEINIVRKHLSLIKGGQLARAAQPALLVSFILSDVIGDPLDVIASGPTVPDPSSYKDACRILKRYHLINNISPAIKDWIQKGMKGEIADTPKPGDPIFEKSFNHLIGSNQIALNAAVEKAKELGYTTLILTNKLQGEAKEQASLFVQHVIKQNKLPKPMCILMGGETTVTIKGKGKGGRNQEFALAALEELIKYSVDNSSIPLILSAGTDGTDGPTEATGAIVDKKTIDQAEKLGLDPLTYLQKNDSYHFFKKAGGHIITGPTQTNVMDIVIALG